MKAHRFFVVSILLVALAGRASAQPEQLAAVWEYATPGLYPQAILCDRMERPYLHVALKNGGLAILDIGNPKLAPKQAAVIGTAALGKLEVMHLTQHQDRLYLAVGDFFNAQGADAGLAVVSVANPRQPKVLSVWKSPGKMHGAAAVLVAGKYAYLGAMQHGVLVFDVSDPGNIKKVGAILPEVDFPRKNPTKIQHPNARGFAIKNQHLYVAFDAGGLRVLDIQNPLKPVEIGRHVNIAMLKKQQAYNNLVIDGTTAYVAVDYAGLEILDISNPRAIKQLAWWNPWKAHTLENLWFNSPGHTNQIEYDAKRQLVYLSAGDSDLLVVDVSNKAVPKLVARHGQPKDKLGTWGLTLAKDYVYLAYINAVIPFHGTWSGLKAIQR